MKKRFLIVSSHPDDAELALGGTIIKLKQRGHRVVMIDLTNGEPTPFGSEKRRQKETEKATRVLGVDVRDNLGLENRYLSDDRKARLLLAEKIRIYRPDVLFCPVKDDAHPDHVVACRITEAARFYAKYTKVSLKGGPHYAGRLFYFFASHLRRMPEVSFFIDISEEFELKMKAVRAYRSQFVDNIPNRFVFSYLKDQNAYFGSLIRRRYAEPVFSREHIGLEDPTVLI